jgi:hypothetical protein
MKERERERERERKREREESKERDRRFNVFEFTVMFLGLSCIGGGG